MDSAENHFSGLKPVFSPIGIWAFSIGTSIGWGSFIITCNTYLLKSGVLGTFFGLLIGLSVILAVTINLQYIIKVSPGAGGIYTFGKRIIGKDFGFIMFWFILLTYFAILWANITSVPLFSRFFAGTVFQFGFHYSIFGYEVWFGEALLSILTILLIGLLCSKSSRIPNGIVIASAIIFITAGVLCALTALIKHDDLYGFSPLYLEGSSSFSQIVQVAAISPWAFIGFENISHFSEEYTFPIKKIRRILIFSVLFTTLFYILVSLLSVCAYPPEYPNWFEYIQDMGNLRGIKAVPAFYSVHHYMGNAGIVILMISLFAVILTSLIGNLLALSRLLYAAGRSGDCPHKFAELNAHGIPSKAIYAIVAASVFVPFLGRTIVSWIVDITTLGATMIYGMLSYAVFCHARNVGDYKAKYSGLTGTVLMIFFLLLLLIPRMLPFHAIETESYVLFIVWSVVGLIHFCFHCKKSCQQEDTLNAVVWIGLLVLVLFASMMLVSRTTEKNAFGAVEQILTFHENHPMKDSDAASRTERLFFLNEQAKFISQTNILYTVVSIALFVLSASIILYTYKNEKKLGKKLNEVEAEARSIRKIAELKHSISSLLDNIPGINFSKDAKTGVYLACNQHFAEYVKKETPEQVVGLTDKDLFDEQTTAKFAKDDSIALSMKEPFIFYETLTDLDGKERQFQTTKLKFIDSEGRECLLCMTQDMTNFVRIQYENASSKEAYEKMKKMGIVYTHIAMALASNYINLYYVNLETGEYIEYIPVEEGNRLDVSRSGNNFFESCKVDAEQFIHPEDRWELLKMLDKQTLINHLKKHGTFINTYRVFSKDGKFSQDSIDTSKITYVNMKISRMKDDERFIIIGIYNVDEQVKNRRALERMKQESIIYNRLSALSGDYVCIYIVTPENDCYREYSSNADFSSFSIPKEGSDFFNTSREQIRKVIYHKDLENFLAVFTKENVMTEIEQNGFFSVNYRLMFDNKPVYVQLKAVMVEESEGNKVVIGVTNIDSYVRKEKDFKNRLEKVRKEATMDALTGIRNKYSYLNEEEKLNKLISENKKLDFAIVIFDVNNLKTINDTLGHQAGDKYLCDACKIICDTFKHSPVFRVGGDEFTVIAEGEDYNHIDELIKNMNAKNEDAILTNGITIACGVSKFNNDANVASVYERADNKMYENKTLLKQKQLKKT